MLNGLEDLLGRMASYTDLGHTKRDHAFLRQIECLCRHPNGTAAGSCSNMASVVSAHRFARNESVKLSKLRFARMKAVLETCAEEDTVLVINDMSVLSYRNHESKSDRRPIGDGRGKGYEYVCNLAVGLESENYLGVLHDSVISANGSDDVDQIDYHANPTLSVLSQEDPKRLERNHCHMLASHFKYISQSAPGMKMVSVGDREFDDHLVFESAIECGQNVVIRSSKNRNVQASNSLSWINDGMRTPKQTGLSLALGHGCYSVSALVENVPTTPFKRIALDGKGRLTDEKNARSHAEVSIGSFCIKLYRPPKRSGTLFPIKKHLDLNVVVLKEPNPPKGRPAIEWVLYTTLPVDTPEQLKKIVRIYELRWLIENFFKYLKSGLKIEDLRYNNARKTAVHLVGATIAATFVCRMKSRVGLPHSGRLSSEDYARVKNAATHPDDESIPSDLRLFAFFATQGGWLGRRADPISPLTLMKGWSRVSSVFELIANASGLLGEIASFHGGFKKCV